MSEPLPVPEPAPAPRRKGPSLLRQLEGVFTDPVNLFRGLWETPVWGGALILVVIAGLLMTLVWGLRVDVDAMLRPILEQNPDLSSSQIDQIIGFQSKLMLPISLVGVLVGIPVACLIAALVRWLVGKGLAEAEPPSFVQALSSVTVASLVSVPYLLLTTLMCLLRPVGGLAPEKLSPTSLGFYLRPESAKLYALFCQLDLFLLAGYVMVYLSCRHALRLKPVGAGLCTLLAVLFGIGLKVAFAK